MTRVRLITQTKIKLINKIQDMCWVCGRSVSSNDIFIVKGKDRFGNTIIRHRKCHVGSVQWLKSAGAKQSKFYKFYKKKEVEELEHTR